MLILCRKILRPNFTFRLQRLHYIFIHNKFWLRHIRKSYFFGIRHRTNMFRSVACYLLSSDHLLFFWAAQTVVSQRFRRSFSLCRQSNRNPIFHQRVYYIIKRIVIRRAFALNYPTPFKCRDYARVICETRFYLLRSRSLCIPYKFRILPYCNIVLLQYHHIALLQSWCHFVDNESIIKRREVVRYTVFTDCGGELGFKILRWWLKVREVILSK